MGKHYILALVVVCGIHLHAKQFDYCRSVDRLSVALFLLFFFAFDGG